MKRRVFALICAMMLLALPALAAVPTPTDDFYVLDQANVLTEDTEWHIVYNNDRLYEDCGAQIVIVTVDSTDGKAIDDYANELFNSWGIGGKDNYGFLVLMAIRDDNYYALSGTNLEKKLSSGQIKLLLDDALEPDFAAQDYDAGARSIFDASFAKVASAASSKLSVAEAPALDSEPVAEAPATQQSAVGSSTGSAKAKSVPVTTTRQQADEAPQSGGFRLGILLPLALIVIVAVLFLRSRSAKRRRFIEQETMEAQRQTIQTPPPQPTIFQTRNSRSSPDAMRTMGMLGGLLSGLNRSRTTSRTSRTIPQQRPYQQQPYQPPVQQQPRQQPYQQQPFQRQSYQPPVQQQPPRQQPYQPPVQQQPFKKQTTATRSSGAGAGRTVSAPSSEKTTRSVGQSIGSIFKRGGSGSFGSGRSTGGRTGFGGGRSGGGGSTKGGGAGRGRG